MYFKANMGTNIYQKKCDSQMLLYRETVDMMED